MATARPAAQPAAPLTGAELQHIPIRLIRDGTLTTFGNLMSEPRVEIKATRVAAVVTNLTNAAATGDVAPPTCMHRAIVHVLHNASPRSALRNGDLKPAPRDKQ